ncbi:MAG TPA: M48 family metalloprotease [Gemmataceae bacterium]
MSRIAPLPSRLLLVLCGLTFTAVPAAAAAPPTLKDLTPAVRARIDRLAAQHSVDTLRQEKIKVAADLSLWALSHLALAPEEEFEHAQAVHKEILKRERVAIAPPAAQRVFRKLLDNLPSHLKPDAFEFSLIVLDRDDTTAFTIGGGFVYVGRPLLDALLADKERGEAALAFVLAHQLGHIGLQHCRRGWQSYELEQGIQKGIAAHISRPHLREALHTGVETAGGHIAFLYTRRQMYEADQFAWQLCRNSGIESDAALDSLRWLAIVQHPRLRTEETYRPDDAPEDAEPPALLRLRRLFMERDGLVDDEKGTYGLFLWDARSDTFQRCGDRSIAADDRPIVFVHGFRGSMRSFRDYLHAFAENKDLHHRKFLVFRYPNSTSLGRCGQFLCNEMRRVVAAPEKAVFVCHSAGGLVFRWYAEVRKQPFERAVLLSTPNEGTSITALKYLADLSAFADELKMNGPGAIARMIPEGDGQIIHDVHADSLFLRHLGHNADLAKRYHVFSGECLTLGQAIALDAGITVAKRVMLNRVLPRIDAPVLRRQAMNRIEQWRLPPEISRGDLVVSMRSALLKDAGHATRTALNHEQFKTDELVIRDVMDSILGK